MNKRSHFQSLRACVCAMALVAQTALVQTCLAGVQDQGAKDLHHGDPAPPLDVRLWLKGTPVTAFEKDKVYVLEFWATWCLPCKEVFPKMTKLAREHKDVTFLGIGVYEDENLTALRHYVDSMGDAMDYNIGYSGAWDGMARSWLLASGFTGIPSAFIVQDGAIQYMGPAFGLEEVLPQVKARTFDRDEWAKVFEKSAAKGRKLNAFLNQVTACRELHAAGRVDEAKAKLDSLLAVNPTYEGRVEKVRFQWLATEDPTAWEATAKDMAASENEDSLDRLCAFAVEHDDSRDKVKGLPLKALSMALAATKEKSQKVLGCAVRFYKQKKDYKAALAYAQKLSALVSASDSNAAEKANKREVDFMVTELKRLMKG